MLDPTCADITGRVLEALAAHGLGRDHAACGSAAWNGCPPSGSRWKLVRPVGRGVHLWHLLRRCAGLAASGGKRPRSPRPARRRMAALRSERRCGWAKAAPVTTIAPSPAARSTPSQTPGRFSALIAGGDDSQPQRPPRIEYLLDTQARRWKLGRETGHTAPLPEGVLLELHHLYKDTSRLLALSSFVKTEPTRKDRL